MTDSSEAAVTDEDGGRGPWGGAGAVDEGRPGDSQPVVVGASLAPKFLRKTCRGRCEHEDHEADQPSIAIAYD